MPEQVTSPPAGPEPGGSAAPGAAPAALAGGLPGSAGGSGLSWAWDIDFGAVQKAIALGAARRRARRRPGRHGTDSRTGGTSAARGTADAGPDSDMGLLPSGELAGIVAEFLTPGPDLAGWLTLTDPGRLEDYALAGVAVAWRRLAAWATAGELAAVGQMAARVAARDSKVGLGEDGRPTRVTAEAATEIALAEAMSQSMASWWADLAVSLSWRLPAVGAALWAGQIDLGRARKIAEATRCLSEQKAREVAAAILPEAGDLTMGELTARLRRAVLAADPEGADERRSQAEAEAKVVLHPDDEGTATLAGYNLPAIQAAAAMARITAMAKACKAAGQGGGIDRLRAQVMLGLLLGTLGHIPPADGAPDEPPSDGGDPDGGDPDGGDAGGGDRDSGDPDGGDPDGGDPDGGDPDGGNPEDSAPGEHPSDGGDPGNDAPPPPRPRPGTPTTAWMMAESSPPGRACRRRSARVARPSPRRWPAAARSGRTGRSPACST